MSEYSSPPLRDVPDGMVGHVLNNIFDREPTRLGVARARLQAASLALVEQHKLPSELSLVFTPNGATEPLTAIDPCTDAAVIDERWLGNEPSVHAIKYPAHGFYGFGVNAVSPRPKGGIVVDTISFELKLPTKGLPAGAIALHSMARYYTAVGPKRPDLTIVAALNHAATMLRLLTRHRKNATGDQWGWLITPNEPSSN